MERRWMKPGRGAALALIAIAAGLATVSRTPLRAQEPAKPSARGALRQKIADLHGELALRELEHEVAREALKQRLMNPPTVPETVQGAREALTQMLRIGTGKVFDTAAKAELLDLVKQDFSTDAPLEQLSRSLDEVVKTKDFNAANRAVLKWLEGAETWSKAKLDGQLITAKKDFVIQAATLCLKKLELEDLEKQYRDSR